MKLINRHNFISIVCISFTAVVCGKLIFERLIGFTDANYSDNILTCLAISVFVTGVLSLHYYLQRFPLIPVMIVQYAVTIGAVFLFVWISGFFEPQSPSAYRDMFVSVTIPYIVGAFIYYLSFFRQVRRANEMINEINNR